MLSKIIKDEIITDADFDLLFPAHIRTAAEFHFTPIDVAMEAARFLVATAGAHVLDIGSGAGKFCLIGAATTNGVFTGVEQRAELSTIATKLALRFNLSNTQFINANLINVDFSKYQAFYIFNPFMEHRTPDESLDSNIDIDQQLYSIYSDFVKDALAKLPVGTRLATYFSYGDEVPDTYVHVGGNEDAKLRFWIKG